METTLPRQLRSLCASQPDKPALLSKDSSGVFQTTTYGELWKLVERFAAGLLSLGTLRGDHIGIISDNRKEWIVIDLAALSLGAADVPRGSDSTADEIGFILGHADCKLAFLENKQQLDKLVTQLDKLPLLKRVVIIDEKFASDSEYPFEILSMKDIYTAGDVYAEKNPGMVTEETDKGQEDDLATLIYTSGTTGQPKGVMLPHRSFLFQIKGLDGVLSINNTDTFITVLPIWHSFERAVEYFVLSRGAAIAYSKPMGKILLGDMAVLKPTWMPSVPRIWEGIRSSVYRSVNADKGIKKTLFHFFVAVGESHFFFETLFRGLMPEYIPRNKTIDTLISALPLLLLTPVKMLGDALVFSTIKKKIGGRFKVGVSGGGALPPHVDRFFQAAGILVLEGYGLTEAGPIISVRLENRPVPGTVGPFLRGIEYRVIGEDMAVLPVAHKGVLYIRSPQVMLGYYKNPEETAKVLQDGWLNTGDIVSITHGGEIKIHGRAKDTIVLMGGENVEPEPIENKISQSDAIDQVMVVGQDQKFLAALIVPNMERIEQVAIEKGISFIEREELCENPDIQDFISSEIQNLINAKTGFKAFERIFRFKLLPRAFEVGREMTHSLKIRRNIVNELYRKEISSLFQ